MNGKKTYIAVALTIVTFLTAKFGLQLDPEIQQAIAVVGAGLIAAALRHGMPAKEAPVESKNS